MRLSARSVSCYALASPQAWPIRQRTPYKARFNPQILDFNGVNTIGPQNRVKFDIKKWPLAPTSWYYVMMIAERWWSHISAPFLWLAFSHLKCKYINTVFNSSPRSFPYLFKGKSRSLNLIWLKMTQILVFSRFNFGISPVFHQPKLSKPEWH